MSDRILGAVCVLAAIAMAWAAQDYTPPFAYEPVGPRAFPRVLAGLMAIGGAWLALKPTLTGNAFQGAALKLVGFSAAAVFVYALLFQTLGFPLATTLVAVPVGLAFGGGWKQALAGGIGLGLGLFLLFDKLLEVTLPTGVLSFVFGGH